ncbi:hypothetical protein [Pseudomonas chlororaphis]|uniref:hypothetical protein n=1 Tax=Pseudomonas chlororaphis TaxID=587753 RepID=UPI000F57F951|nr:hypothetical protein [Pseudomonas chlororaphis]
MTTLLLCSAELIGAPTTRWYEVHDLSVYAEATATNARGNGGIRLAQARYVRQILTPLTTVGSTGQQHQYRGLSPIVLFAKDAELQEKTMNVAPVKIEKENAMGNSKIKLKVLISLIALQAVTASAGEITCTIERRGTYDQKVIVLEDGGKFMH